MGKSKLFVILFAFFMASAFSCSIFAGGSPSLESISLDTSDVKKVYLKNQYLNLDGLIVKAFYSNNTSKVINNYKISEEDDSRLIFTGDLTITVSYGGKSADFTISVLENSSEEESLTEVIDDLPLDLNKISLWDASVGNYDKDSQILEINKKYSSGQIWLGNYDASDYNYLVLECSGQTESFSLNVRYDDAYDEESGKAVNQFSNLRVEKLRKRACLELDKNKRSLIKAIYFQSISDSLSVKIEKLYFIKERVIEPIIDTENTSINTSISALDLVKDMKAGWNLGNSLEPHGANWDPPLENKKKLGMDTETIWGHSLVTEDIIKLGKEKGYSTIRIPVTWYNHFIDDKYVIGDEYIIDPDWMARVKEVVDWAYNAGYYVILNEHHSVYEEVLNSDTGLIERGYGYNVQDNAANIEESKRFLKAIWTQIAKAFNGSYGERLIFETMNEPRNADKKHFSIKSDGSTLTHQWQPGVACYFYHTYFKEWRSWCDNRECQECKRDYEILNEYNQLCLDTIRSTGGNNAYRFVMIPSMCTGSDTARIDSAYSNDENAANDGFERGITLFRMPVDSAEDKLILTVHNYCLGSGEDKSLVTFTEHMKEQLNYSFSALYNTYVEEQHIPVVVGETGAYRETPLQERLAWINYFAPLAKNYGMSVIYWDTGKMALFDRDNLKIYAGEEDFVRAFVSAFE